LPLGDVPRAAGSPPIEIVLDVGLAERQSRRTTVHDAAHRGAVTFAERRDSEELSERIPSHAYRTFAAPNAAAPLASIRALIMRA
jgi:hypothetical protein